MKIHFESEQRSMTLLSAQELLQFDSEMQARIFLNMFAQDPANMETMRRVVGEEYSAYVVSGLDDHEVIDHIARMITHTCYGMVRVELRHVIPANSGGADGPLDDAIFEGTPLGELLSELEDVIPKAVLPPIFPEIARIEVGALEFELKLYNITLDLLRYAGMPIADVSEMADEFVETASRECNALIEGAESFSQKLLGIAEKANLLDTFTEVGATFTSVAVRTGELLTGITQKGAETLDRMLQNTASAAPPSEVVPELRNLVSHQATQVIKLTQGASTALDAFRGGAPEPEAPSEVADLLQKFSGEQGQGVVDATTRATTYLTQMFDKAGSEPPQLTSLVLDAVQASVLETGAGIVSAARGVTGFLAKLAPPAPPVPTQEELDEDAAQEAALAQIQAQALAEAQANAQAQIEAAYAELELRYPGEDPKLSWEHRLGGVIDNVYADTQVPEWAKNAEGTPSEMVTAVHQAVREQAEGMVNATRMTLERISQLKVPVKNPGQRTGPGQSEQTIPGPLSAGGAQRPAAGADPDAHLSPVLKSLREAGIDIGKSLVLGPDNAPSEVGVEILKSVHDQKQRVTDIVRGAMASIGGFAPPVIRRSEANPAAAPSTGATAAASSTAAAGSTTAASSTTASSTTASSTAAASSTTAAPAAPQRPAWVPPLPPPLPDWTPPEVEVPPAFGGNDL